jgi:hypothetical protein
MLEFYVESRYRLRQLRECAIGDDRDPFAEWLHSAGFRRRSAQLILRGAAHLGEWADIEQVRIEQFDQRVLNSFADHLATCGCTHLFRGCDRRNLRGAKRFVVAIWPFETLRSSATVEIYPAMFRKIATDSIAKLRSRPDLNEALARLDSRPMPDVSGPALSDHETDALLSAAGLRWIARNPGVWSPAELTSPVVQREGWIFGVHIATHLGFQRSKGFGAGGADRFESSSERNLKTKSPFRLAGSGR